MLEYKEQIKAAIIGHIKLHKSITAGKLTEFLANNYDFLPKDIRSEIRYLLNMGTIGVDLDWNLYTIN